jgi:hypothetical protein
LFKIPIANHPKSWIFCEKDIHSIDSFTLNNWQERLFLERLELKAQICWNKLMTEGVPFVCWKKTSD